jgi:amino acid permease
VSAAAAASRQQCPLLVMTVRSNSMCKVFKRGHQKSHVSCYLLIAVCFACWVLSRVTYRWTRWQRWQPAITAMRPTPHQQRYFTLILSYWDAFAADTPQRPAAAGCWL